MIDWHEIGTGMAWIGDEFPWIRIQLLRIGSTQLPDGSGHKSEAQT